ncbi:hypothetical protein ACTVKF_18500 [Serratia marcescens]|uniref:hypothetical protein n=1 Tax=Serratia TaxID=613 RepID=UPI000C13D032|nr:hypothetical protein [Serratia marcescens]MDX6807924.1 hypothetical protein [Serratia marcescens]PHY87888.1 hypothetical protein CS370_06390 [Serratia marcescens]HBC7448617.1 hypothetical protein [Serratia marcescens]
MKERPVIFNGEMVRAILDGRKTQTRRVIANVSPDNCIPLQKPTKTKDGIYTHVMDAPAHGLCPFGQVGDRLWVRETFAAFDADWKHPGKPHDLRDGPWPNVVYPASVAKIPDGTCRPSIHMPRWASRILLEITAVRVERLNDISEEDAKAEGVAPSQHIITPPEALYRVGFLKLWQSIYGEESWRTNPWVWVIEFKQVSAREVEQ